MRQLLCKAGSWPVFPRMRRTPDLDLDKTDNNAVTSNGNTNIELSNMSVTANIPNSQRARSLTETRLETGLLPRAASPGEGFTTEHSTPYIYGPVPAQPFAVRTGSQICLRSV